MLDGVGSDWNLKLDLPLMIAVWSNNYPRKCTFEPVVYGDYLTWRRFRRKFQENADLICAAELFTKEVLPTVKMRRDMIAQRVAVAVASSMECVYEGNVRHPEEKARVAHSEEHWAANGNFGESGPKNALRFSVA